MNILEEGQETEKKYANALELHFLIFQLKKPSLSGTIGTQFGTKAM